MTIAERHLREYAERSLRTGSGMRMDGQDTASLDNCQGGELGEIGFAQCSVTPITLNIHNAY
jgi:hypothetical protein